MYNVHVGKCYVHIFYLVYIEQTMHALVEPAIHIDFCARKAETLKVETYNKKSESLKVFRL